MQCCKWHVAFVQDCNLRCSYCATNFGRFGGSARVMGPGAWRALLSLARRLCPPSGRLCFEFGGGETFLAFDAFLEATDLLRSSLRTGQLETDLQVITNGTLLNPPRLQLLADRGISLEFSIDGPEEVHDSRRRGVDGKGSHRVAFENWKRYAELAALAPRRPRCTVKSVLMPRPDLAGLTHFWEAHGQPTYNAVVQLPARFREGADLEHWRQRQANYLTVLREWAVTRATVLRVPTLLSHYRGPLDLLIMWKKLLLGACGGVCGAFRSTLAVDADGIIYPCEGFIGFPCWAIGTVESGVDGQKLEGLARQAAEASQACIGCECAGCCPKSCPAAFPERTARESFHDGCSFARELVKVAQESYAAMAGKAGTKPC